jgi:hypothetical protein
MAKASQQVQLLLVIALLFLSTWHHATDAAFTERFDTVVNEKTSATSTSSYRSWSVQPTPFL